jgi:hypothetical protein
MYNNSFSERRRRAWLHEYNTPVAVIQGGPVGDAEPEEANWDNASWRVPHQNKTVGFGQRPRPLHNRHTRTGTCVRWGMAVAQNRYNL